MSRPLLYCPECLGRTAFNANAETRRCDKGHTPNWRECYPEGARNRILALEAECDKWNTLYLDTYDKLENATTLLTGARGANAHLRKEYARALDRIVELESAKKRPRKPRATTKQRADDN